MYIFCTSSMLNYKGTSKGSTIGTVLYVRYLAKSIITSIKQYTERSFTLVAATQELPDEGHN